MTTITEKMWNRMQPIIPFVNPQNAHPNPANEIFLRKDNTTGPFFAWLLKQTTQTIDENLMNETENTNAYAEALFQMIIQVFVAYVYCPYDNIEIAMKILSADGVFDRMFAFVKSYINEEIITNSEYIKSNRYKHIYACVYVMTTELLQHDNHIQTLYKRTKDQKTIKLSFDTQKDTKFLENLKIVKTLADIELQCSNMFSTYSGIGNLPILDTTPDYYTSDRAIIQKIKENLNDNVNNEIDRRNASVRDDGLFKFGLLNKTSATANLRTEYTEYRMANPPNPNNGESTDQDNRKRNYTLVLFTLLKDLIQLAKNRLDFVYDVKRNQSSLIVSKDTSTIDLTDYYLNSLKKLTQYIVSQSNHTHNNNIMRNSLDIMLSEIIFESIRLEAKPSDVVAAKNEMTENAREILDLYAKIKELSSNREQDQIVELQTQVEKCNEIIKNRSTFISQHEAITANGEYINLINFEPGNAERFQQIFSNQLEMFMLSSRVFCDQFMETESSYLSFFCYVEDWICTDWTVRVETNDPRKGNEDVPKKSGGAPGAEEIEKIRANANDIIKKAGFVDVDEEVRKEKESDYSVIRENIIQSPMRVEEAIRTLRLLYTPAVSPNQKNFAPSNVYSGYKYMFPKLFYNTLDKAANMLNAHSVISKQEYIQTARNTSFGNSEKDINFYKLDADTKTIHFFKVNQKTQSNVPKEMQGRVIHRPLDEKVLFQPNDVKSTNRANEHAKVTAKIPFRAGWKHEKDTYDKVEFDKVFQVTKENSYKNTINQLINNMMLERTIRCMRPIVMITYGGSGTGKTSLLFGLPAKEYKKDNKKHVLREARSSIFMEMLQSVPTSHYAIPESTCVLKIKIYEVTENNTCRHITLNGNDIDNEINTKPTVSVNNIDANTRVDRIETCLEDRYTFESAFTGDQTTKVCDALTIIDKKLTDIRKGPEIHEPDFHKINAEINKQRTQNAVDGKQFSTKQTTQTTHKDNVERTIISTINNPQSSRSIIVYKFLFQYSKPSKPSETSETSETSNINDKIEIPLYIADFPGWEEDDETLDSTTSSWIRENITESLECLKTFKHNERLGNTWYLEQKLNMRFLVNGKYKRPRIIGLHVLNRRGVNERKLQCLRGSALSVLPLSGRFKGKTNKKTTWVKDNKGCLVLENNGYKVKGGEVYKPFKTKGDRNLHALFLKQGITVCDTCTNTMVGQLRKLLLDILSSGLDGKVMFMEYMELISNENPHPPYKDDRSDDDHWKTDNTRSEWKTNPARNINDTKIYVPGASEEEYQHFAVKSLMISDRRHEISGTNRINFTKLIKEKHVYKLETKQTKEKKVYQSPEEYYMENQFANTTFKELLALKTALMQTYFSLQRDQRIMLDKIREVMNG